MGRPGKPVKLLLFEGKKHLTKKEVEVREETEIRVGESETAFECPDYVLDDKAALKKWMECKKIYESVKDLDLISSGDLGHLARYCKTYSEYLDLVKHRKRIADIEPFKSEEEEAISEEFEGKLGARQARNMWTKVEYIMSVGGLMAMDKAINGKMVALIAMEDRLFLNPRSKVVNVPKQKKSAPKTKLERAGFDL